MSKCIYDADGDIQLRLNPWTWSVYLNFSTLMKPDHQRAKTCSKKRLNWVRKCLRSFILNNLLISAAAQEAMELYRLEKVWIFAKLQRHNLMFVLGNCPAYQATGLHIPDLCASGPDHHSSSICEKELRGIASWEETLEAL
jgi:hypothetical protein